MRSITGDSSNSSSPICFTVVYVRSSSILSTLTAYQQDLESDTDQDEHPVFICCIAKAFFWDPNALGVIFHDKFKLVPLLAVALVLTTVNTYLWLTNRS
jgi:hypothetical protein